MQTMDAATELAVFDGARDAYAAAMQEIPPEALAYLRPGDDYSLGGLTVHVNYVFEHYRGVLQAMQAADFAECRPEDPPELEKTALRRARAGLTKGEVDAELEITSRLHRELAELLSGQDSLSRTAPVWYPGAKEVYPTSGADVLGWLTGHYREHIPHIGALTEAWRRESETAEALALVESFNAAFGSGDVGDILALMTEDCIFENTFPAPDGERHVGHAAMREFCETFFAGTDKPRFSTEEIFAAGDRVITRWRFDWGEGDTSGHVRGVDVTRVRDGRIAEKLAYVKG